MKSKRYIWLPLLLLAYGITMAVYFGKDHIASGNGWRLTLFIVFDVIICVALFFFLKRRIEFDRRNRDRRK